ncbi:hypothetical protein RJZ56_005257 [Blastomyces dermatitidis]|uniref:DUF7730 domain-containing protein n=3 Tax=Blastomyces TaxID=229219 RepID=A0A179UBF6_BLAGS|nr:uncharacterized protein BDBG_01769 [Blastomyces gilchristii SLH14081]XP_045275750.1 uncharacterized protein BDCG_03791 [Blastomyces dermatitidis ER-3]EGE77160.1 hypothetical protein BDDG_00097 [Blastomyces dermatitidis ATCC 18188]EQL38785.1 hypothetical protein BDFG_00316 [Blastomyces dermatitidis ATCC 26199]EEQ88671.1 hypothetical protein BDCG_03791 [Blastomyces dermatitidis ER-3]OAT05355.1 hypothetical protein BDBG_01769 [Blastomyces gilchristii SLH14081]
MFSTRFTQPQSPLLGRLPFEIRQMIWTYLYRSPKNVHIVRCLERKTKLQYVVCREGIRRDIPGNCCKFCLNASQRREKDWAQEYGTFSGLKRPFGDLVAVGKTCWFAYTETRPYIYSECTFIFATYSNFLHFTSTISAVHCHQYIRSVKIYWNLCGDFFVGDEEDFLIQLSVLCDTSRSLSGLRRFVILMPPVDWYEREDMVAKVLAPLESMHCPWELSVHLTFHDAEEQLWGLRGTFRRLGWRGVVSGYKVIHDPRTWIIQVLSVRVGSMDVS